MHANVSCYAQIDILDITSYELHSSVGYTLRLGAQWQLKLLNYLVARMENTAVYKSARTGNFSAAETEKLQPDPFSRQQKCC